MKKLYILGFLGLAIAANAQNKSQTVRNNATTQRLKNVDYVATSPVIEKQATTQKSTASNFNKTLGVWDTEVGQTRWINQTSGAIYRRLLLYPNSMLSTTWTASSDDAGLTRGSGYNHFANNAWGPSTGLRIEQQRTGFPTIQVSPLGKEVILSHRVDTSGRSGGLVFNENTGIGSNSWTSSIIYAPANPNQPSTLWPHSTVSGDYLIVASVFQDSTDDQPAYIKLKGVRSPLIVRRYQFSTQTWLQEDSILTGFDSTVTTQGRPDTYSIDANGSNVAIVYSDVFSSTVLWKSTDNGATWAKTIIDTFPVPNYVYDKDTLDDVTRTDGAPHVLVDGNGKAHFFTGKATFSDSIMNDGSYTYSFSRMVGVQNSANDGILYWSEYDPTYRQIAVTPPNADQDSTLLDGSFREANYRYEISNATWPSAGLDSNGKIYVVFSGLTPADLTEDALANYRDIYLFTSSDSGTTWSSVSNLTSHIQINREEIYPTIAKNVDNNIHLTYLLKSTPGTNSNTGDTYGIRYLRVPVSRLDGGTLNVNNANKLFTVASNYPNPFSNSTIIPVTLTEKATVNITVMNILGEVVYNKSFNNNTIGVNEFEVNAGFKSGFYFYTVEAGGFKTSGKMLAE
jgi:hypothetical protein